MIHVTKMKDHTTNKLKNCNENQTIFFLRFWSLIVVILILAYMLWLSGFSGHLIHFACGSLQLKLQVQNSPVDGTVWSTWRNKKKSPASPPPQLQFPKLLFRLSYKTPRGLQQIRLVALKPLLSCPAFEEEKFPEFVTWLLQKGSSLTFIEKKMSRQWPFFSLFSE